MSEMDELRNELKALRRQVAQLRWFAGAILAAAVLLAGARSALTRSGRPDLPDLPTQPSRAAAGRSKPLRVRAPLEVVNSSGRVIATLGEGTRTGGGYLATTDGQGNLMTYSGVAGAGASGLVLTGQAGTDAGAALYVDGASGHVKATDPAGNTTLLVPGP